jgi:Cysteine-rich secretory protein family
MMSYTVPQASMQQVGKGLIRKAAAAACAIVACHMAASPAAAKEFPPIGGSGDVSSRVVCPTGQFLVGLSARSGSWVDRVSLTCASLDHNGTTGPHSPGKDEKGATEFGGTGGAGPKETTCAANEIVIGMGLLMTAGNRQVRLFELNCASMKAPTRHNIDIGNNAPVFPSIRQDCPHDEAITGMVIRHGKHVNAIGTICGRKPDLSPQVVGPGPGAGTGSGTGCAGLAGDELAICNQHNADRAAHGVPPLTWDPALAANAAAWVKDCHKAKDKDGNEFFCHQKKPQPGDVGLCGTDASYNYGENLSFGIPGRSGQEAIDGWYCEGDDFDYNNPKLIFGTMHGCGKVGNPDGVNGHFTQVVWKSTTALGCAKATCSLGGVSGTLWACEYKPPGNDSSLVGQNVLKPVAKGFAHGRQRTAGGTVQTTTGATSDVDLYDQPGGHGKKTGILRKGQHVALTTCRGDNWCQVAGGWVWGAYIARSHSR